MSGNLTSFVAAEGDQFILRGLTAVIDRVASSSQILLKKPWSGPTISGANDWDISLTGPYWQSSVSTNKRLSDLLRQFEVGPVKWDKAGNLAQRDGYNDQPEGFTYLVVDPMPFRLYTKLSSANAASSWSNGQILGSLDADFALTRGGEFSVNLGLPAILTIAQEVLARGVIPAARLGITGGTTDQTSKWQAGVDALLTYKRPVELNAGLSHRIGQRLAFPQGSGIVNPGGAVLVGDCADFNNISRDLGPRYGSNAVMLLVDHAKGVRFEGLKLVLQAGSAAAFKDRYVQGIVSLVSDDLKLIDVDISGFNAGNMVSIQSSKNALIVRPYLHDGIVHTDNTNSSQTQLTAITVDGDEALDNGMKIGSTGRIEYARVARLRATAAVIAATSEQTDAFNIAGNFADFVIVEPYVAYVNEGLDCFGRVKLIGGQFYHCGNFGAKLVHGADGCHLAGFQIFNAGIAALTLQSTANEVRGLRNNELRGSIYDTGTLSVPELTVNGVTAPALTAPPVRSNQTPIGPGETFEVLINEASAAYPIENTTVDVSIRGSGKSTNPVRVTTTGANNVVRFSNQDGTTDAKTPVISGSNTVRRTDKSTCIIAYATNPQPLATTTTVVNYGTKVVDTLGEWNGNEFAPKLPGKYLVRASTRCPGQNGDTILLSIRKNGVLRKSDSRAYGPDQLAADVSHIVPLVLGDKLDIVSLLNRAQSNTSGEQYTVITITRAMD